MKENAKPNPAPVLSILKWGCGWGFCVCLNVLFGNIRCIRNAMTWMDFVPAMSVLLQKINTGKVLRFVETLKET